MVCDVATRILKLLVYLSYDKLIDNIVSGKTCDRSVQLNSGTACGHDRIMSANH